MSVETVAFQLSVLNTYAKVRRAQEQPGFQVVGATIDPSSLWSFNLISRKLYPFRQSGHKALVVGVELIGVVVQRVIMGVIIGVEAIAAVIIAVDQQVLVQIVTMGTEA